MLGPGVSTMPSAIRPKAMRLECSGTDGSPKDRQIPPPWGEGKSIQLALDFFIPLPAEDLVLALEGFDQAPDDPMGLGRFMARIGLDPGLPVATPELLSPMRLH